MKEKNVQIEYIRAISAIAVVIIHTFNSSGLLFGDTAPDVMINVYWCVRNLMWWAVPCFLMISGYLLLNHDRKITIEKIFRKYVLRMIIVLFTFGFGYAWLELFFKSKTVRISDIWQAFLNVLSGNTWAHMWYIYCLIGIYLLLPVYKAIADHVTDKELKYILIVLLVFNSIFSLTELFGFTLGFYCHVSTIYPFWFLMGEAFNRKLFNLSKLKAAAVLCISTVLLVALTLVQYCFGVKLDSLFGYSSVLVVVQSVSLFRLLYQIHLHGWFEKIVLEIADKSFGIYLLHMLFVNVAYKLIKINPFTVLSGFSAIPIVIANLIVCYIIVSIMKKIPGVRKIV